MSHADPDDDVQPAPEDIEAALQRIREANLRRVSGMYIAMVIVLGLMGVGCLIGDRIGPGVFFLVLAAINVYLRERLKRRYGNNCACRPSLGQETD